VFFQGDADLIFAGVLDGYRAPGAVILIWPANICSSGDHVGEAAFAQNARLVRSSIARAYFTLDYAKRHALGAASLNKQ